MKLVPSLKVKETYDDNVTFSRTDKQDDFVTSINPELMLEYATELLSLESRAALDLLRYADDSDLDTENYRLGLTGRYGVLERFTLSGNFSYLKDTTLESELEETGLVNLREDRERYTGGGGISYKLSERSDVGLDYTYGDTRYDSQDQVDYDSHSLTFSYNRYFNDQLDVFTIQPYYVGRDSDISQTDNYGLSLGWAHAFSETWRMTCFLGARYTEIDYVYSPWYRGKESTRGGVADMSVAKTGEITTATIGYSRDLHYSSYGEPIETDKIYLRANRMMTRRLGVAFSGSLYFTESEGEFLVEDSSHVELSPSLNYRLTRQHSLRAGYSYSRHCDKTRSRNEDYDRHRAWVLLDFRFPQDWWL